MKNKTDKKENGLKEFFRPTRWKIRNAFILVGILFFVSVGALLLNRIMPNLLIFILIPLTLFFVIPTYFTIIILLILPYTISCYIDKRGKLGIGILLYLIISLVLTAIVFYGVNSYNDKFGKSCEIDSDCHIIYGEGVVNNNYISLMNLDPLGALFVFSSFVTGGSPPVCKENMCGYFRPEDAKSVEDCEIEEWWGLPQAECYGNLAKKLNDITLCNNINGGWREYCLKQFTKK